MVGGWLVLVQSVFKPETRRLEDKREGGKVKLCRIRMQT